MIVYCKTTSVCAECVFGQELTCVGTEEHKAKCWQEGGVFKDVSVQLDDFAEGFMMAALRSSLVPPSEQGLAVLRQTAAEAFMESASVRKVTG